METHYQVRNHVVEQCDATTGHTVHAIAFCDTPERAQEIFKAVNAHDSLVAAHGDLVAAAKRMMTALRNARDTRPEEWNVLVTPDICNAWTETMSALRVDWRS